MPAQRPKPQFDLDLPSHAFRRRRQRSPAPVDQPDITELSGRLQRFGVFSSLPAQELAQLAESTCVKVFQAGEYIWHEGQKHDQILFIEKGLAKASRVHGNGVKRTYGLYGPGDTMGLFAIWSGVRYPTDAIAMNDGMTAMFQNSNLLIDLTARYPGLIDPLMSEISRFTESFLRKIDIVSAGTISQRLATLMSVLIERYGIDKQGDFARLPFKLTLEQISEIVDARIETVARTLSQWRKQGWLQTGGDGCHFTSLSRLQAIAQHT